MLLAQGKSGAGSAAGNTQKLPSIEDNDAMDEDTEGSSEDDEEEEEDDTPDQVDAKIIPATIKPQLPRRTTGGRNSKGDEKRNGAAVQERTDAPKEYMGISPDVVERGIITMQEATDLFDRYVNVLVPNYPAVVFPPNVTASQVRKDRPILQVSQTLQLPHD